MDFVIHNWFLFLALVVVLLMLGSGPLSRIIHGVKSVNSAEAVRLINRDDGVIVDVCEPREYQEAHIANSINIPLGSLTGRTQELGRHKGKPIIVSCRSGNRSVRGAVILRKNGFESVYTLNGGLTAWQRDNLPTEK